MHNRLFKSKILGGKGFIYTVTYHSLFSESSKPLLSSSPLCCVIAISAWPFPPGPFILMNSTLAGPFHQPIETLRATLLATLAWVKDTTQVIMIKPWSCLVLSCLSQGFLGCNKSLNPLTLGNDWHVISLYNIFQWITHKGHQKKENDHWLKKLLIVPQILLVSTLVNVWRTVWRICILMLV